MSNCCFRRASAENSRDLGPQSKRLSGLAVLRSYLMSRTPSPLIVAAHPTACLFLNAPFIPLSPGPCATT